MSTPHPHTSDSPLRVVVSLDVEEEGLFSGHYATSGCGVSNVSLLPRLAPLSRDLGFPLTLFCAHTVFADAGACRVLEQMRDHYGAEIGAHLHHWSTPPASPLDPPTKASPHARTNCRATCCASVWPRCWMPGGNSRALP